MRRLLAVIVSIIGLSPVAPAAARLSPAQMIARKAVIQVWGARGRNPARARLGVQISRCESTWRTWARNGTHRGLFQMGSSERRLFGHGPGAYAQARAALAYYFYSASHSGDATLPWLASRRCWS